VLKNSNIFVFTNFVLKNTEKIQKFCVKKIVLKNRKFYVKKIENFVLKNRKFYVKKIENFVLKIENFMLKK